MAGGQDLAFAKILGQLQVDLKIVNGDYLADAGLETAALVSLFSDRFVEVAELPPNIDNQKGWWGDDLFETVGDRIGSRLWIFDRIGKIDIPTRNGMVDAIEESLQWMIDVGLAETVVATGTVVVGIRIDFIIEISRPEGDNIVLKPIWDGQELKLA